MRAHILPALFAGLLLCPASVEAGEVYRVTANDGKKTITYEVRFGGGRMNDQYTAFDPETKKFVYLQWPRDSKPPAPAMRIWDHHTGQVLPLYKFPKANHPLPVIPSIEAMKVCPLTRDKNPQAKLYAMFD